MKPRLGTETVFNIDLKSVIADITRTQVCFPDIQLLVDKIAMQTLPNIEIPTGALRLRLTDGENIISGKYIGGSNRLLYLTLFQLSQFYELIGLTRLKKGLDSESFHGFSDSDSTGVDQRTDLITMLTGTNPFIENEPEPMNLVEPCTKSTFAGDKDCFNSNYHEAGHDDDALRAVAGTIYFRRHIDHRS